MGSQIVEKIADIYPQLYLDPDRVGIERYKDVMLKGDKQEATDLSWYIGDPRDKLEILNTPAGDILALTFYVRSDFEYFLRSMMAAKDGPENKIPASQGASMLRTFNWQKIRKHMTDFYNEQKLAGNMDPDWDAEWVKFTSVKSNYMDFIVVLSTGPYSAVSAERMGLPEAEWKELSGIIRKYHEITHVICQTKYPDQVNVVWDELVADAIGIYAAFGSFDPEKERIFLGLQGDQYTGGRLGNYTDDPQGIAAKVNAALAGIDRIISEHSVDDPFSLIDFLQESQKELYG